LCHVCRSPTPWNASGERLCKTVSVCQSCVDRFKAVESKAGAADEAVEIDVKGDECDECYDRDVEDAAVEEEEGENQVVASVESSSSRFCNGGGAAISSKRVRENPQDLPSDDGLRRSTSHRETSSLPAASSPPKRRKTDMT